MDEYKYQSRVEVVCRIRPPTQGELYINEDKRSNSSKKSTQKLCKSEVLSPTANGKKKRASSLTKDCMFSFFTCEQEPKSVIAANHPVKGSLISTYFKNEKDLENYQSSVLESSMRFRFDKVYSIHANLKKFYKEAFAEKVAQLLNGVDSTILLWGGSGTGKKYTLRGEEGKEKGILANSVEDLLNLVEIAKQTQRSSRISEKGSAVGTNFSLLLTAACVDNYKVYDLLATKRQAVGNEKSRDAKKKLKNLVTHEIKTLAEIHQHYRSAMINIRTLSNQSSSNQEFKRNTALIFSLIIRKNYDDEIGKEEIYSRLKLVTLPFSKSTPFNHNVRALFDYIVDPDKSSTESDEPPLLTCLKDGLHTQANVVLVGLISPSSQRFQESVHILKYSQDLKKRLDGVRLEESEKRSRDSSLMSPRSEEEKDDEDLKELLDNFKSKIQIIFDEICKITEDENGFSSKNIGTWLSNKEREVESIRKQVKLVSKTRRRRQEFSKEFAKLNEIKKFLNDLKDKIPREIRSSAFKQNKKPSGNSSPSFENSPYKTQNFGLQPNDLALIVPETKKFSKKPLVPNNTYQNLMERYSKAKESLENLKTENNNEELPNFGKNITTIYDDSEGVRQKFNSSEENGSRENIRAQINISDRTINKLNESKRKLENVHKKFDMAFDELKQEKAQEALSPSMGFEFKSSIDKTVGSPSVQQRSEKKNEKLLIEDEGFDSEKERLLASEKQLKKLRRIIETEQVLDKEQNKKLKDQVKELKESTLDFEDKVQALRSENKEKDKIIENLEVKVEELEKHSRRQDDQIKELKSREEILIKNEAELREIIADLRVKLDRKKDRVRDLGENLEKYENQALSEIDKIRKELETLEERNRRLLESNDAYKKKQKDLQSDNDSMKSQIESHLKKMKKVEEHYRQDDDKNRDWEERFLKEKSKYEEINRAKELLLKNNQELKENIEILEAKVNKLKKISDEEKRKIVEENSHLLEEKKSKCKALKKSLRDLEQSMQRLQDDVRVGKQEIDFLTKARGNLEKEMNAIREENKILGEEKRRYLMEAEKTKITFDHALERKQEEINLVIKEKVEILKQVEEKEAEIDLIHRNNEKNVQRAAGLEDELQKTLAYANDLQSHIKDLEDQIIYLENKQGQDLDIIEHRLDNFLQETSRSKSEVEKCKKIEEALKRELSDKEKDNQVLKKKLEKYKKKLNEMHFQIQETQVKANIIRQQQDVFGDFRDHNLMKNLLSAKLQPDRGPVYQKRKKDSLISESNSDFSEI